MDKPPPLPFVTGEIMGRLLTDSFMNVHIKRYFLHLGAEQRSSFSEARIEKGP